MRGFLAGPLRLANTPTWLHRLATLGRVSQIGKHSLREVFQSSLPPGAVIHSLSLIERLFRCLPHYLPLQILEKSISRLHNPLSKIFLDIFYLTGLNCLWNLVRQNKFECHIDPPAFVFESFSATGPCLQERFSKKVGDFARQFFVMSDTQYLAFGFCNPKLEEKHNAFMCTRRRFMCTRRRFL